MSVWPDPQSIRVGPTYYCYYKAGDATTTITITTTTSRTCPGDRAFDVTSAAVEQFPVQLRSTDNFIQFRRLKLPR